MQVVVCGAGIIGASVAYYLAKRGVRCTVVERCSPACAASGKAGGFLARDWCDQGELGPLARISYVLHAVLASEFGSDVIDYRQVNALSVLLREGSTKHTQHAKNVPCWLDSIIGKPEYIGSKETTAQVHPYKLTNALLEAAAKLAGSFVKCAIVTGIATEANRVVGVNIDGGDVIPADVVVLAMGPWTSQAARWLPGLSLPVTGDPVHSIVLKPEALISADMLFTRYQTGTKNTDPEIYPRPDGTVYVCGQGSKPALPDDPASIISTESDATMLRRVAESASSFLADADLVSTNCCYLPSTPDGLPLIGRIPNVDGVYVAAGHSCWGILEGPATGACIAELIVDGSCSLLDLSHFDPSRAL